jgi:hypothetical protein
VFFNYTHHYTHNSLLLVILIHLKQVAIKYEFILFTAIVIVLCIVCIVCIVKSILYIKFEIEK